MTKIGWWRNDDVHQWLLKVPKLKDWGFKALLKAKRQCWGLRPVHGEVVHAQLDVQLQVFPLTEPENANLSNFVVTMIYSACLTTYDMVNKHCDDKTYECKFDQFCILISCLMRILTTYDMVAKKQKWCRAKLCCYHDILLARLMMILTTIVIKSYHRICHLVNFSLSTYRLKIPPLGKMYG